ncbi:MAG: hypothetical protein GXO00_03565 [Candidatus Diapherotrites archaeon]|nr:hypothetical protein [Candidatus Diapherotrites archaeon]
MISGAALELLKEWYRQFRYWPLAVALLLVGLSIFLGAHPEAATVYPTTPLSWIAVALLLLTFTYYLYTHTLWISEVVGHHRGRILEEHLLSFVKVFLFFVLMSLLSFALIKMNYPWMALLLWVLLFLYPFAVIVDDVGEVDNLLSSIDAWRRNPGVLLEFFLVGSVLLLTAFYLEAALGWPGVFLSIFLTLFFTIPFLTTLLALAYLLRYPLTRRALLS